MFVLASLSPAHYSSSVKVLHVMECTIGGTRRHLVDVALGQAAAGLEVHVVASTLRDPGFPQDLVRMEGAGVSVHRLDMVRSIDPSKDRAHAGEIAKLLQSVGPDIVHTHSSKAGVLGRHASLKTGIGTRVHTPHTFAFLFKELFGPAKRFLYRKIEGHYARRSAAVIAVSESEAETFRSSGVVPADRVRTVANGIDLEPFERAQPLDLAPLGPDPDKPIAALVGLVYAAKGQDFAIRALANLPELQLLCVGPGDASEYQALAKELGVSERVFFTGARDDVPAILAAADFLVLPSRWEGMPYIVIEAMAAGRAVVANPVNGARDLVLEGETGWLTGGIDAGSVESGLRAALEAGPERRSALGKAGQQRVREHFTTEHMVRALLSVYEEVLP